MGQCCLPTEHKANKISNFTPGKESHASNTKDDKNCKFSFLQK